MYIKCLVENTNGGLEPKHGLSFYIETKNHKILFDLGPDDLFYRNALISNIDISKVDTVIISHGHDDHGGGLATFLKHNNTAKVYLQKTAFEKHYSRANDVDNDISLDFNLKDNPQIVLLDGDYVIDSELRVFTAKSHRMLSPSNGNLLDKNKEHDVFEHEHSLLIKENKNVLFAGCSHCGVLNIIDSANENIDAVIGGFHLSSPRTKQLPPIEYLERFKEEISKYDSTFYTCHCTGEMAYEYLKGDKIKYINCGMSLEIK